MAEIGAQIREGFKALMDKYPLIDRQSELPAIQSYDILS
jgi:hypothetical protein